ncbi:MAG TPA: carboxypeptidase-like regulatory domain-containing protein, partial [Flavobacteriales bacterium]|nr:carboxypeptidase-like regulatory domain-containing protein [Flavobacteriales bacterium]
MRNAILVLLSFLAWSSVGITNAQSTLRGLVLEVGTSEPVADANLRVVGTDARAITDAKGRFTLECGSSTEVTVVINHLSYTTLTRTVKLTNPKDRVLFWLTPNTTTLPEAVVGAKPLPEVVFERKDLHVGAYHVNEDGLWVLGYDSPQLWHREEDAGQQVLRGAKLFLLDTLFREMDNLILKSDVRYLHHDHAQRTVVEGVEEAWMATRSNDHIVLGDIDLKTLRNAVLPWTDSIPGYLLGNNLDVTYPAFDHFAHSIPADTNLIFCQVVDKHLMELFRSQYKYMQGPEKVVAMNLAVETGIDAEIIAGYMTGFPNDIYFHVPYAPLFVVHDTLCVFDHYKERIHRFTKHLAAIDSVPILHQRDRDWDGELLQDPVTDQVYVVYQR